MGLRVQGLRFSPATNSAWDVFEFRASGMKARELCKDSFVWDSWGS